MKETPYYVAPGGIAGRSDRQALKRIAPEFVHKVDPLNVILSRVDRVTEDTFEAEIAPDWDHPLFFEHALDHVPSMMLVEAGRQFVIALTHLHLDVPLGAVFITMHYDITFTGFAEVFSGEPVLLGAKITERQQRRGRLDLLVIEGRCHQAGRPLGVMHGSFRLFPRELYLRFRRKAHQLVEP